MAISQRIFDIMRQKGLKQKDLSDFTGISTSAISAWNKNGTSPTADKISTIAEFLGVSVDYLLTGTEKSPAADISADEQELLTYYKELDDMSKGSVLGKAEGLAEATSAKKKAIAKAIPKSAS